MQHSTLLDPAAAEGPAACSFTATLVPSHALPPKGFRALLFNVAGISYLSVFVFFFFGGRWLPVLWCADAVLCYAVYRWVYAPGRRSETIELTEEKLSVTRVDASGKAECWDFNPYWVRIEHNQLQGKDDEIWLSSHARRLMIGAFLREDEKRSFTNALRAALALQRDRVPVRAAGI